MLEAAQRALPVRGEGAHAELCGAGCAAEAVQVEELPCFRLHLAHGKHLFGAQAALRTPQRLHLCRLVLGREAGLEVLSAGCVRAESRRIAATRSAPWPSSSSPCAAAASDEARPRRRRRARCRWGGMASSKAKPQVPNWPPRAHCSARAPESSAGSAACRRWPRRAGGGRRP